MDVLDLEEDGEKGCGVGGNVGGGWGRYDVGGG